MAKNIKKSSKLATNPSGSIKNGLGLNLILFPFSLILHIFSFLYQFLIKIPGQKSHILGIFRLVFWGSLFMALVNKNASDFPYVTWGIGYENFMNYHPFLNWTMNVFMVINLIVQLFVAAGVAYDNQPSGATFTSNSSDYPAINEGIQFLDDLLAQESTRGKVTFMKKMFGGQ